MILLRTYRTFNLFVAILTIVSGAEVCNRVEMLAMILLTIMQTSIFILHLLVQFEKNTVSEWNIIRIGMYLDFWQHCSVHCAQRNTRPSQHEAERSAATMFS